MQLRIVGIVALIMAIVFGGSALADPPKDMAKIFDQVIKAVASGDRQVFVKLGTQTIKNAFTPELMKSLKDSLGKRLDAGYSAEFLCELNQAGLKVYLWKVAFEDDGDDVVVRIAMQEGLLAGLFLQ